MKPGCRVISASNLHDADDDIIRASELPSLLTLHLSSRRNRRASIVIFNPVVTALQSYMSARLAVCRLPISSSASTRPLASVASAASATARHISTRRALATSLASTSRRLKTGPTARVSTAQVTAQQFSRVALRHFSMSGSSDKNDPVLQQVRRIIPPLSPKLHKGQAGEFPSGRWPRSGQ